MVSVPGVRDLVEAEGHERRRLVGALTLGDPWPAEPDRPGRAVVAALALGAITLAVGLLLDALSGSEPPWPSPGLVVSRESGSTYVVLDDGRVHPVTDGTSARLLLGQDAGPPVLVDRAEVDAHDPGARLGIAGAPASVPAPDRLVAGGWSACAVGDDEVAVGVGGALRTYAAGPPTAVTVRSPRGLAVVTTDDGGAARAYRLPGGPGEDNLLLALGLPGRDAALAVPTRWLRLVPAAGVLTDAAFVLPGLGDPLPYAGPGLPASARVGDWFPRARWCAAADLVRTGGPEPGRARGLAHGDDPGRRWPPRAERRRATRPAAGRGAVRRRRLAHGPAPGVGRDPVRGAGRGRRGPRLDRGVGRR